MYMYSYVVCFAENRPRHPRIGTNGVTAESDVTSDVKQRFGDVSRQHAQSSELARQRHQRDVIGRSRERLVHARSRHDTWLVARLPVNDVTGRHADVVARTDTG